MLSKQLKRLGASSEMLALSSSDHVKNILVCLIEVIGALNVDKIFYAARKTADKFPQLHSVLNEVKIKGLHYLEWEPTGPNKLPVFFHDLSRENLNSDSMEKVLVTLSTRLDRDWNLLNEVSSEFHCIKVSDNRFLFGWLIHHAAGDAALASDVGQETVLVYSESIHGSKSDLTFESLSLSGSRKKLTVRKKRRLGDHFKDVRQTFQNLFLKPTVPLGNGDKSNPQQHHAKRVFLEDESANIQSRIRSKGLSLIDTLVAASHYAIDEWNLERGVNPGFLTSSVSVNMRGRFRGLDRQNSSSLIFFESSPEKRLDSTGFLKSLAIRRIHHFRNQEDLKLDDNIRNMMNAVRILPYNLRKKLVGFITNRHEFSVAVTLLGVIWPMGEKGRLTSDSAFTEIGGLQVEEVIGIPYRMLSKTRTLLVLYIFRNRLNFVLSTSASLMTKEENQAFLDLIIDKLKTI